MWETAFFIAQLVVALVGGLIAAGLWVALGGLGAISNLKNRTVALEDEITRLNERLSRDQKVRAGQKGVEARTEARSVQDEATLRLASNIVPAVAPLPGRSKRRT